MKTKAKPALEQMTVDDFFENIDQLESTGDLEEEKHLKKSKSLKKQKKKVKKTSKISAPSSDSEEDEKSYEKGLKNLKNTDPELFSFLDKNDKKLLNFGDEAEDPEPEPDETIHKPSDGLEVASDESDYEGEDGEEPKKRENAITLKLLQEWQTNLQSPEVSIETIRNVIKAFNSALISVSGDINNHGAYIVEGAAIFNGIIQLCVLHLEKAIRKYLKLSGKANLKEIQKCKRFSKVKNSLRSYLTDLTKLLESISSSNILSVILKHLHQICSVLTAFTSITKPVLKRLIQIWSTGEESTRIVAFLCILKITRNQQELFLNQVLKIMYLEYVRNSKFVSPNSLPSINFMRRSLTELFLLDLNTAYHHVFLFIRQLAIHLRNAIVLQKKEHFMQIHNWQYVNSLRLWGDVLSTVAMNTSNSAGPVKVDSKSKLIDLIYPLVNIVTGVIKLKPSANYFPLRFHCVKILIDLSRATKVYIPILPFVIEVLNSNTFKQKPKKHAMKPLSFSCILRIQKGHLEENSFKDEVIEQVFAMTLECLINECTSIAFPDLVVPHVMALNHFVKHAKGNNNHTKKLKQLSDKIMEQSNYIDNHRSKINFSLNDTNYVKSWEVNMKTGQTPLEMFYNNWKNENTKKLKRQKIEVDENEGSDEEHDYGNLPKVKAPPQKKAKKDGPVVLFPSDDEDDDDSINFDGESNSEDDESASEVEKIVRKNGNAEKSESDAESSDGNDENENFLDNGDLVEDLKDW